jgi:hypothetical protein
MYTLSNVVDFLTKHEIKIREVVTSSFWEIEDDCILLDNNLSLQIGEDYIGITHEGADDKFTSYGYFKKSKGLAVFIHTLIDRYN